MIYVSDNSFTYSKNGWESSCAVFFCKGPSGVLPVTTSSKPQRISDAQNLFSFDLTAEEVDKITELGLEHEPLRLYWNKLYDKYNYAAQKV